MRTSISSWEFLPVCKDVANVENWHEGFISTTHTTAADVWTRRVIVWIVFGSMEVEAMSCKDEWLDAAEMFCEDS